MDSLSLVAPDENIKQVKMTKEKKCHSERSEESLLWLTFCYDAILHFVQNVPIKIDQCVCFACGTNDRGGVGDEGQKGGLSLVDPKDGIKQAKNDKQSSPLIPLLWRGQGA